MPDDNDAVRDVESEPSTLTDGLGGEERLEDPILDLKGHARSCVAELDEHLVAVGCRADGERAACGCSLPQRG